MAFPLARSNKRKPFDEIRDGDFYIASEETCKNQRVEPNAGGDMFPDTSASLQPLSSSSGTGFRNVRWEHMFSLLIEWGVYYGSCNVSRSSVAVLDDCSEVQLGEWLKRQRRCKRRGEMQVDRLMLLQKLVDGGHLEWDKTVPSSALPVGAAGSNGSGRGSADAAEHEVTSSEGALLARGATCSLSQDQDVLQTALESSIGLRDLLLGTADTSLRGLLARVRGYLKECTGCEISSLMASGPGADTRAAATPSANRGTDSSIRASIESLGVDMPRPLQSPVDSLLCMGLERDAPDPTTAAADTGGDVEENAYCETGRALKTESEAAILSSINTFPISPGFRRVVEPKLLLSLFGVSVVPAEAEGGPVPSSSSSSIFGASRGDAETATAVPRGSDYKYKKFWYCCAGRKCVIRRSPFDITDSNRCALRHLRKVHCLYVSDASANIPCTFPLLCEHLAARTVPKVTVGEFQWLDSTAVEPPVSSMCAHVDAVPSLGTALEQFSAHSDKLRTLCAGLWSDITVGHPQHQRAGLMSGRALAREVVAQLKEDLEKIDHALL